LIFIYFSNGIIRDKGHVGTEGKEDRQYELGDMVLEIRLARKAQLCGRIGRMLERVEVRPWKQNSSH
jgi:hypothetical protein